MTKPKKPAKRLKVPHFRTEAKEANWWYRQRTRVAGEFQRAAAEGRLGRGSVARRGQTPTTTIRLDPADIVRARALAARKGLRYQTYLKMLLHEALSHEEDGARA